MKFFVPEIPNSHAELAYKSLADSAKSQMRIAITPKRIYGLRYVHDRRPVRVVVGGSHPEHPGYMILAILESQPHIVMAQSLRGGSDLTILVNTAEITEVTEFD